MEEEQIEATDLVKHTHTVSLNVDVWNYGYLVLVIEQATVRLVFITKLSGNECPAHSAGGLEEIPNRF